MDSPAALSFPHSRTAKAEFGWGLRAQDSTTGRDQNSGPGGRTRKDCLTRWCWVLSAMAALACGWQPILPLPYGIRIRAPGIAGMKMGWKAQAPANFCE